MGKNGPARGRSSSTLVGRAARWWGAESDELAARFVVEVLFAGVTEACARGKVTGKVRLLSE